MSLSDKYTALTFFSFLDFLVPVDFVDFIEDVLEAEGDSLIDEALDKAGEAIFFDFIEDLKILSFNFKNTFIQHGLSWPTDDWYLFSDIYWFY